MPVPRLSFAALAALALLAPGSGRSAQDGSGCAEDAMLVFDGSASMFEIALDSAAPARIEDARIAVRRIMPQVAPYRRIGLVTYGPGARGPCENIDLRFPPIENAAGPVIAAIDALQPAGLTPLTASVQAAAQALDYRNRPGTVVLVTDGNETCGGRPCALGDALNAGAAALTVHVVGFRIALDFWPWDSPEQMAGDLTVARCLAERTGGIFVTTETVDELVEALRRTLGCPVIGEAPRRRDQAAGWGQLNSGRRPS